MLGGFIKPTHLADFLERQPSLVNHSTNPSFEQGSGTVEVRRNLFDAPRTITSGTGTNPGALALRPTWFGQGGGVLEIVSDPGIATPIIRKRWTASTTENQDLAFRLTASLESEVSTKGKAVLPNTTYTISYMVRFTGTVTPPSAPNVGIRLGYKAADGSVISYNTPPDQPIASGEWVKLSLTFTTPADTAYIDTRVNFNGALESGSCFDITQPLFEQIGAVLPYFDGSTNDGFDTASLTPSWTGEANNSASVLTGQGVLGASLDAGTGWSAVSWLSNDDPDTGSSFNRTLVRQVGTAGNVLVTLRDSDGVTNSDEHTFLTSVRINKAVPPVLRQFYSTSGGWVVNNGYITLPVGEWYKDRFAINTVVANQTVGYALPINAQFVGAIIDIGKHFVVKGDYKGGWFSGTFSFSDANRSTMDNWRAWLRSQGAKGFNTHDLENQWLRSQGYTGTFADMFYAKFGDRDGARAFFKGD